jgi:hypothetical protein
MPQSHLPPEALKIIAHPPCPKCQAPMWLATITPADEPGYDSRRFECTGCAHTQILIVKFRENNIPQSSTEFMELSKRSARMAQNATDSHTKAQYEKLAVEWAKAAYEKAIADQKDE